MRNLPSPGIAPRTRRRLSSFLFRAHSICVSLQDRCPSGSFRVRIERVQTPAAFFEGLLANPGGLGSIVDRRTDWRRTNVRSSCELRRPPFGFARRTFARVRLHCRPRRSPLRVAREAWLPVVFTVALPSQAGRGHPSLLRFDCMFGRRSPDPPVG